MSLAIVFVAAINGYHFLGGYGWLESAWMVVITISTVGYGEHSTLPASVQILTMLVILLGVTSSVYTFGGFIQLLLEGEVERAFGRRKMTKVINRLSDHVIICGFGRMGIDLARQLEHRKIPFVVIDKDPEKTRLAELASIVAINGDATSEEVLQAARLSKARALVTALPSDAENVFITLTARNLRPNIQIIAKSERESSCKKLRQAGANKIVMPHRVGAQQMERMISRPTTADLVELFAEATQFEMELDELHVPATSYLVGSTIAESNLKDQFNVLVIGIKAKNGELHFNPNVSERINSEDTLLVIGNVADINRMRDSLKINSTSTT